MATLELEFRSEVWRQGVPEWLQPCPHSESLASFLRHYFPDALQGRQATPLSVMASKSIVEKSKFAELWWVGSDDPKIHGEKPNIVLIDDPEIDDR